MTSHRYYPRGTSHMPKPTHMGGRTRDMYKSSYMGGRTRHAPKPTHMPTHMGGRTKEEHRRKRKTMNKKKHRMYGMF